MTLKSSFIEEFLSDLRRLFSKGYHKIMEPMEASAKSTDPEEVIDLQDDQEQFGWIYENRGDALR